MSEKAKADAKPEEGKKKKGKLPIILVLVLVLGGGGFFMMKGKGGPAEKPAIKIGEEVVEVGEVLVNLRDGTTYARVNVGLQFESTFDTHHMEAVKPVIRDAIIVALSSKAPGEIRTEVGKTALKVEIAESINHSLHALHPAPEGEKGGHEEGKSDAQKAGHDANAEGGEHGNPDHGAKTGAKKVEHPDWHSQTGPVLKVYFSDFVTQ